MHRLARDACARRSDRDRHAAAELDELVDDDAALAFRQAQQELRRTSRLQALNAV